MILIIKNNSKNLFTFSLVIFHIIFFLSILLVDGYPQTNDILHIFKITALERNLRFINGMYGPGYAYYTFFFSNSITILSFIICFLSVASSTFITFLLNNFTKNLKQNEKFTIYLYTLLFHLIIIVSLGFNHSDSLFFFLLYNGILIFVIGHYLKDNKYIYYSGLFFIAISILFRHHGSIFLLFLFTFFLFFEIYYCKKKLNLFIKKYLIFAVILYLPFFLSQIHLSIIEATAEWQTRFKLHYFVHGDTWGNWRDLKYVLQSEQYLEFNIFEVNLKHLVKIILNHLHGVFRILYPFIFCFLITFYISRKKIVFITLGLFIIYIFVVLAGYHRGYYPSILLCFFAVLICYKELAQKKVASFFIFVFLFGHLVYLTERYSSVVIKRFNLNNDIKKNVVPLLINNNIKYENIFSDDYNFYTTKLDGKINKLCNWGGWFLNHPYLKEYYPRDVILGKNTKYCDIKVLITEDKSLAQFYLSKGIFNHQLKTDIYHILIKD